MTETGILLVTSGGSRFWHRCTDPKVGAAEMDAVHADTGVYGPNYRHPETVVEFGTVDAAGTFTADAVATRRIARPVAPSPTPAES